MGGVQKCHGIAKSEIFQNSDVFQNSGIFRPYEEITQRRVLREHQFRIFFIEKWLIFSYNRKFNERHLASFSSSQDFSTWQKIAKWKKSANRKILPTFHRFKQ